MSRPRPDPHPLALKLAGQLSKNTLDAYARIWRRIEKSHLSGAAWFNAQVAASVHRADKDKERALTKRTVVVLRAAVERYIAEFEKGDLSALPPKGQLGGFKGSTNRRHMEDPTLAAYNAAASKEMEPYCTILRFLPLTGLRIHEVCDLRPEHVTPMAITVVGKGNKTRVVPLSTAAALLLTTYMRAYPPVYIEDPEHGDIPRVFGLRQFESGVDREVPKVCTPRDVWRAVQRMRSADPLLAGMVIHQTRHTTATRLLRRGSNMKRIQEILGHKSITTLERYLHSTEDELRQDLEKL